MRILYYDFGAYTYHDVYDSLKEMSAEVDVLRYKFADKYNDSFFCERMSLELKKGYDAVFSVNFFPLVAKVCGEQGVPYLSWSYDSPLEERLSEYFHTPDTYVFLFDRLECAKYNALGFSNVFHMPLAVNTDRLDKALAGVKYDSFLSDISFVGKLYQSPLPILLSTAPDYVKGYIDALVQAQIDIYGCNFLESAISDQVVDLLNARSAELGQTTEVLTRQGLGYAISSYITALERPLLLNVLSELGKVTYYGDTSNMLKETVKQAGPVRYLDQMPEVFRRSRLNLCPTLRSIASGIPLRALDIVGSGGVLFANFQPEIAEYFVPGEDVILYESLGDSADKAAYYLQHPEECKKIAANGRAVAAKAFRYEDKLTEMLRIAGA